MRSLLSSLACVGLVAASSFQDASPFLLFSTSEILASPPQITTAESLISTLEQSLSKCPTDLYVLVHQPGVSADDYSDSDSAPFAGLSSYFSGQDKRIRSAFSVAEVAGHVDPSRVRDMLQTQCGAGTMHMDARLGTFDLADEARPRVMSIAMDEIPASGRGRRTAAHVNEMYLRSMIDLVPVKNFTVVYMTTPVGEVAKEGFGDGQRMKHQHVEQEEDMQYEMDHTDGYVHMELRRDADGDFVPSAKKNGTSNSNAPLFEKYQYLTPALFMGLAVSVLLLLILYVGISAIASLEVSYAAFDKENGPQAQRKQQ